MYQLLYLSTYLQSIYDVALVRGHVPRGKESVMDLFRSFSLRGSSRRERRQETILSGKDELYKTTTKDLFLVYMSSKNTSYNTARILSGCTYTDKLASMHPFLLKLLKDTCKPPLLVGLKKKEEALFKKTILTPPQLSHEDINTLSRGTHPTNTKV